MPLTLEEQYARHRAEKAKFVALYNKDPATLATDEVVRLVGGLKHSVEYLTSMVKASVSKPSRHRKINKFVILASGPSLVDYDPADHCDAVILAVNRAALFAPCDYWCVSDSVAIEIVQSQGGPVDPDHTVLVTGAIDTSIQSSGCSSWRTAFNKKWIKMPTKLWRGYTFTLALAVCHAISAGDLLQITTYGVDWKGTNDWDGRERRCDAFGRSDFKTRWLRERKQWQAAVQWCGEGLTINRHGVKE